MRDLRESLEGRVWLKLLVFVLPATLLPFVRPQHSRAEVGLAWIVGALLQALIPPRTKALIPIVVGVVAFAVIYSFVR